MKNYLPIPAGLALLAATGTATANEYDQFLDTSFERATASDNKSRSTTTVRYKRHHRRSGTIVGANTKHHRVKEHGRNYRVNSVNVRGAKRVGRNTHVYGGVGQARVKARGHHAKRTNVTTGHVGVRTNIGRAQVNLRHEKGLALKRHGLTTQSGKVLTRRTNVASVKYHPTKRTRLELEHRRSKLNDGNRHRHTRAGAYYGVTPNVWVGVTGDQRRNSKQTKGYWTPKKHESVAVNVSGYKQVNPRLGVYGSASAGKAKEHGIKKRYNTTYASVGAKYKISNRTHVKAELYNNRSRQGSDKWHENGGMVNVVYQW